MKKEVSWGSGESDLFLNIKGGKPEVLEYRHDTAKLHEMCGGKNYYCSRSGASGAGYFTNLGSLIQLGTYRVDTVHNDFQRFLPIGKIKEDYEEVEVKVAVPYTSHSEGKSWVWDYPTVVKFGKKKVVYCDFNRNFIDTIKLILAGKALPEECEMDGYTYSHRGHRTLKKTFSRPDSWGDAYEEEVTIEFYNLCSMENTPNPWEFFQDKLAEFKADWGEERIFQLLSVEKLKGGTFVRTMKFDSIKYRGKALDGNPLETGNLTAGWRRIADDVLVRFYDKSNEAHLVAYTSAQEAHEKIARRLADRMGEGEEFISFASSHEGEYAEFELTVPKALFLIDEAGQIAEVRKGLARKVREDVTSHARQWIEDVNDQGILDAIPDTLEVTFEDSLDAGNCRPGTEAFVAQFFPGQTKTTAKELKRYADNYNVMRIFRHLAAIGRFEWQARKLA